MALFKLIKHFELELQQLEKNKSKCFVLKGYNNYKISTLKARIKELRDEVDLRKTQPYQKQDYK